MRTMSLLVALALAFSGAAGTEIPVGKFESVELSNGGQVVVRHGSVQSVSIDDEDLQYMTVRVEGQRLVIDRSGGECPRGHRPQVEVVTPHLSAVSVSNGGTVKTVGAFPAQASIEAAVEQGGTVDIRSIPADRVDASVYSGGMIFTTSQRTLKAAVESGGAITYWGDVEDVKKSIRDG